MSIETVLIEGEEYYILGKVTLNNNIYYCLISVVDDNNFIIRKEEIENEKKILVGLKDEEEFNLVIEKFRENVINESF